MTIVPSLERLKGATHGYGGGMELTLTAGLLADQAGRVYAGGVEGSLRLSLLKANSKVEYSDVAIALVLQGVASSPVAAAAGVVTCCFRTP